MSSFPPRIFQYLRSMGYLAFAFAVLSLFSYLFSMVNSDVFDSDTFFAPVFLAYHTLTTVVRVVFLWLLGRACFQIGQGGDTRAWEGLFSALRNYVVVETVVMTGWLVINHSPLFQ